MTQHVVTLDAPGLTAARTAVLHPAHRYPFPAKPQPVARERALPKLVAGARADGVAAVRLAAPLSSEEFLRLGRALGALVPETAPAVQTRVTAGHILNLVTDGPETTDADQQPFAAGPLLMHTESSGRPLAEQPRYLLFQCLAEAASPVDAQTVVVSSDIVADLLAATDLGLLERVRYRGARHPLLRREHGRLVFSFRDPGTAPLALDADPAISTDRVTEAVTALCAAIYRPDAVRAVPWTRGLLVLLDNHCAFHGRTLSASHTTGRHLQRLRILGPTRGGAQRPDE